MKRVRLQVKGEQGNSVGLANRETFTRTFTRNKIQTPNCSIFAPPLPHTLEKEQKVVK
jgi:hypothetical protein